VASLSVASLSVASEKDVSFDCISATPEEDETVESAEVILEQFLSSGKTCDYSL